MELSEVMIFAVAAALLGSQLRMIKSGFDTYLALATCLIIVLFIITKLGGIIDVLDTIKSYLNLDDIYLKILFKIVGISYITQFSSDICKECGYMSIGNQVQIFGKLAVMAISMPVVMALIDTISYMIG